ncbi:RHS repeat-associated core domain-containing protein [Delftia deserti]|uniref:RHS repeat-associated core domain-containing protein n=1 Tax=Delftia deserti TaxID=1651218 RepID=UPI00361A425B
MVHSQRGARQALYIYEPGSFVPLATVQGAGEEHSTYWYQCDQIGAPLELTDEQGQVAWAADYKVWGEAVMRSVLRTGTDDRPVSARAWGSKPVAPPPPPPVEQPFRFQGQQFDEETGLHYNRFRYYDPAVGRFVHQDPIGLEGGLNLFRFAPNPLIFLDPLGLHWTSQDRKSNGQFGNKPRCECDDSCPTLHRPYIRADVRATVEMKAAKNAAGEFLDANELTPIKGAYHLGHKRGHEFWREKAAAEKKCMSQALFNDHMNNANFYQIEDPKLNMSHKYELP